MRKVIEFHWLAETTEKARKRQYVIHCKIKDISDQKIKKCYQFKHREKFVSYIFIFYNYKFKKTDIII